MNIALDHKNCNILIFSDSHSALQTLNNSNINIKTNNYIFDIKKKFNRFHAYNNHTIKFFWIPAHVGIVGNENADQLAKDATNMQSENQFIPYTDLNEKLKIEMMANTRKTIIEQGTSKGKKYFKKYYEDRTKPWFYNKGLNRNAIVTINRIRADHYNLAASLERIKIVSSPLCQCKENIEDINHVMWQCKLYNNQRTILLNKLKKSKIQLPMCIEIIIANLNNYMIKCIIEYLEKCNLKI